MRLWKLFGALLTLCIIMPSAPVLGADAGIGVHDYWEYKVTLALPTGDGGMGLPSEISLQGIARFEIMSKTTENISGTDTEVLNAKANLTIALGYGGITIGAYDFRLTAGFVASSFDLVSLAMVMNMSMSFGFMSMFEEVGSCANVTPALDIFAGNNDLSVGSNWTSQSTIHTSSSWVNDNGTNMSSGASSGDVSVGFRVAETDVSITVPSGTFSCTKIAVEDPGSMGSTPIYLYYAEKANFYAKMEYRGNSSGNFTAELKSYSVGGGGGVLGGTTGMLIVGGLVAVVVIVAIALILMRRRGAGKAPMQPAQPTEIPPPPPP
jgi:hypothetical protein